MLMPRQAVPALTLPLVGGDQFDLAAEQPENFTLVVFYRGLHCPICAKYLIELARLADDFAQRGVGIVAISSDTEARAAKMDEKVGAGALRFGHSLSLQSARDWGLYLSTSRGTTSIGLEEPALFSEPGVFLVRPDGTLFYGAVQTMPFARPLFSEMLGAIDFTLANNYPARGEYDGALPAEG
jgi:peroxiredoxin